MKNEETQLPNYVNFFTDNKKKIVCLTLPVIVVGTYYQLIDVLWALLLFFAALVYTVSLMQSIATRKDYTLLCWVISFPIVVGVTTQDAKGVLSGSFWPGDIFHSIYYFSLYLLLVTLLINGFNALSRKHPSIE